MATTDTPDPAAATADATVAGREGDDNGSLHASIVSSAHGYFRWLLSQRPPDDCSASSSGASLQRYAGKGGKVLAALVEEFPDLIQEEEADDDGISGVGGDAGPQQQQPALELGRDLSRWLWGGTLPQCPHLPGCSYCGNGPPPPPFPPNVPVSPPTARAANANAASQKIKAPATTPEELSQVKSPSEKRRRRSKALKKSAVDSVTGAGLDGGAKRRVSMIRAEIREMRRGADGVAIRTLQQKVEELEAAERSGGGARAKTRKSEAPTFTWNERYEQLKEFHRGHGHTRVPAVYPTNQGLSKWVQNQRSRYKDIQAGTDTSRMHAESKLTDERMKKLNDLGFVWYARKTTTKTWEERLEDLLRFKTETGHTRVPRKYDPNPPLGNWVHTQRKMYSKKDPLFMGERATRLEALGFEFKVYDAVPSWEERFKLLVAYRAKHGLLPGEGGEEENVGESRSVNDSGNDHIATDSKEIIRLRNWITFQRNAYRDWKEGRQSSLTRARIKKLESIGFNWDYEPSKRPRRLGKRKKINEVPTTYAPAPSWEERIQQLSAFKAEHGHANPSSSYGSGDTNLGIWIGYMKKLHSRWLGGKGHIPVTMTAERFAQLEEMGVNWSKPRAMPLEQLTWEERYEQLLKFKTHKGHTRVPKGWSENKALASWVARQRRQHRFREEGKPSYMTDERLSKLVEIGFDFVAVKEHRRTSGEKPPKGETEEDDGDSDETSNGSDGDEYEV